MAARGYYGQRGVSTSHRFPLPTGVNPVSLFSARTSQSTSSPMHGRKRGSVGRVFSLVASVALSAGVLTVLGVSAGVGVGTAAAATPNITAVGTIASNHGAGTSTLSVTPTAVGNALVLGVRILSGSITVQSVTGGNAGSWTSLSTSNDGPSPTTDMELWIGTVTAAATQTITVTYTSAIGSTDVELVAQEFASGLTPATLTVWAPHTAGTDNNLSAASTNVPFPSLTATSHELYVGYARVATTGTTTVGTGGTGSALTFQTTPVPNVNIFGYNGNVAGVTQPVGSQTANGTSLATAALVTANLPVPTVTNVSPNSGPPSGATVVTITGTNFTGATAVNFGANLATGVTVTNATSITATAPAGVAGTIDVTVTAPGGPSATGAADHYTYGTAPSVASLSPTVGSTAGGTSVTITGANFTGATAVAFGTKAATGFTVNSATQISAVAPAAATGTVDVTVTSPNGTSATGSGDKYTYSATGGYWMVGSDGGVFAFGTAGFKGSLPGLGVHVNNIVGVVPTSDHGGYWMVGSDGGVFAFGDAGFVGSLPGLGVKVSNIVGVVPTSTGKGYWMVGSDGGVFAFGDAGFVGSLPGKSVKVTNIVGVVSTSTGKGYWMVGKDGGVFAFGDAGFVGSVPGLGITVNNITGVVATPDGKGYWMVGKDGGVFAFGDAGFVGSIPGLGITVNNIVAVVPS
jgi:hypothetical protein